MMVEVLEILEIMEISDYIETKIFDWQKDVVKDSSLQTQDGGREMIRGSVQLNTLISECWV